MIPAKPQIYCLMGPTASGKTDLAIELVSHFPFEIISVDSAMVYRGMDIGTAKPSPEVLKIAKHHLIDIRDPIEPYSAGDFLKDIFPLIDQILKNQRVPLLVGGTMMYFHLLQNGLAEIPAANPVVRASITQQAAVHGWPFLHDQLKTIDPISAEKIKPNDSQRIQRALEIYEITQRPLSALLAETENKANFNFINLALVPSDRSHLHLRIAQRFKHMLQNNFVDEVQALYHRGDLHSDLPSLRAVGYRQVWDYLNNILSYSEMQERGIIATRQLAKRQLTWLKSWKNLQIFASEDPKNLGTISQFIQNQMRI